MGGFYGSVQVRSEDRAAVLEAAEMVARAKGIHCLVGPVLGGWIGIYPENHGQDDSVGKEIANQLSGIVLHVMVHDDDVLAYWLWRDRELVDEYWSKPGYFGDGNLEDEQRRAGDAEQFRFILDGAGVKRLRTLLRRDDEPAFESERLAALGKLLRIANVVTSYEYLKEGESDGIKGRRQFVEVPGDGQAAEKRQRTSRLARIKSERRRLAKEGVLLWSDERRGPHHMLACAIADGFFTGWPDFARGAASFVHLAPPRPVIPAPVDLPLPADATVHHVASDAAGDRIAVGSADRTRILDFRDNRWTPVAELEGFKGALSLSADGGVVACLLNNQLRAVRISEPTNITAVDLPQGVHSLAVHPSGQWIATGGQVLGLISLQEQPHWRDIYVGRRIGPTPSAFRSMPPGWWRNIDVDQAIASQKAEMESALAKLDKLEKNSGGGAGGLPSDIRVQARQILESHLLHKRETLAALKRNGPPPTPAQSLEKPVCVGFSRDGRWLWIGTDFSLRVYEFDKLPRDPGAVAADAAWRFQLPPSLTLVPNHHTSHILAVAEEPGGSAIVFAGRNARIYRMDLTNGSVQELLEMPHGGDAGMLHFTPDGSALCTASQRLPAEMIRRSNEHGTMCDVWNYAALRDSAVPIRSA